MINETDYDLISGTLVAYFFICQRKLWLFAKGLNLENISGNVDVIKGRVLHETRFMRENHKEYDFDRVKIDFLKYDDEVIVHEIKKSKKFEEAHIWQLKYYIFTLQCKKIQCTSGVIHYPNSMRTVDVEFTQEDHEEFETAMQEIVSILQEPIPPSRLKKRFCSKCAYFDFCSV